MWIHVDWRRGHDEEYEETRAENARVYSTLRVESLLVLN
jgi:hypothetical protein